MQKHDLDGRALLIVIGRAHHAIESDNEKNQDDQVLLATADMIRRATPDDALAIATLYHHTVKKINSRDYAPTQIEEWAGATPDAEKWRERQSNRTTFVDEHNGTIRGFAELEANGSFAPGQNHEQR